MKYWFGLFALLFVQIAFGSQAITTKITRVGTNNAANAVIIQTDPAPQSTCTAGNKILMQTSNQLFEENLSILLSVFRSDSSVLIYTSGCIGTHIGFLSVSVVK